MRTPRVQPKRALTDISAQLKAATRARQIMIGLMPILRASMAAHTTNKYAVGYVRAVVHLRRAGFSARDCVRLLSRGAADVDQQLRSRRIYCAGARAQTSAYWRIRLHCSFTGSAAHRSYVDCCDLA